MSNTNTIQIGEKIVGYGYPTYIIAELSCNHNQDMNKAIQLIHEAAKAGADAVKMQTYTPDTITLDCDKDCFQIKNNKLWEGQTLYELYSKSYTPWEWFPTLKQEANELGLDFFSSPFDTTAVDMLESINVPCYKIASCEITDHILIKRIAETGKPVIISSGMASAGELEEAVNVLRKNGTTQICMLKCTAEYPAKPEDANLMTIKNMMNTFNVVGGLSDHTLGSIVPITSVALGASLIEKHFTLSRESGSADDAFSMTPIEFKNMVDQVRISEKTIGKITYGGVKGEQDMKKFRRSLFFVKDVKQGEVITKDNVKSIRPGNGLHTKYYDEILGKTVNRDIERGTPTNGNLIE
jgi:pseudaminic acid synthase